MVDELSRIASDTLGVVLRTLLGSRSYRTVQPEREHDPWDDDCQDGDDELPATVYTAQPVSRGSGIASTAGATSTPAPGAGCVTKPANRC